MSAETAPKCQTCGNLGVIAVPREFKIYSGEKLVATTRGHDRHPCPTCHNRGNADT